MRQNRCRHPHNCRRETAKTVRSPIKGHRRQDTARLGLAHQDMVHLVLPNLGMALLAMVLLGLVVLGLALQDTARPVVDHQGLDHLGLLMVDHLDLGHLGSTACLRVDRLGLAHLAMAHLDLGLAGHKAPLMEVLLSPMGKAQDQVGGPRESWDDTPTAAGRGPCLSVTIH